MCIQSRLETGGFTEFKGRKRMKEQCRKLVKEESGKLIGIMTGILLAVTAVMVFVVNVKIPFMMDDLWYSTMLSSEEPIHSIGDIVQSQIWHYFNWGGRSLTHSILQLTLLLGERGADILNLLMVFLLGAMVCVVSDIRKMPALLAAISMIIGLNANWKMSMFWQAGAANYLYITIPILLFLYCYLREKPGRLKGITLWIIPLGILAGWSNENMGPTAWILSLLAIFLWHRKSYGVKPWMVLGNVSCLAGSILMIVAPGNFVRSAEAPDAGYGILWKLFLRCYAESKAALEYLFPTLLLLAFVLLLAIPVLHLKLGRANGLLLLGALLSWGAMVLSPHYPDRATFGTMVLLICVIVSMAGKIWREKIELRLPLFGIMALIWLRGMYYLGEYLALCLGWIH